MSLIFLVGTIYHKTSTPRTIDKATFSETYPLCVPWRIWEFWIEGGFVVACNDDLVLMRQSAQPIVELGHFGDPTKIAEVPGVNENISVGHLEAEARLAAVGVRHADDADLK